MIKEEHRELLNFLDMVGVINQKFVLWWQKGFEGRRVYSENEFNRCLKSINYDIIDYTSEIVSEKPEKRTADIWVRDDVPILIKEYSLLEKKVPVFISIKPMSHDGNEGWKDLALIEKKKGDFSFDLSAYHKPHIRGIVVEDTKDFLFWCPINGPGGYYTTGTNDLFDDQDIFCLRSPIDPHKFYRNIIDRDWSKGKRPQTKALKLLLEDIGATIVPYYNFYSRSNHVTIYPAHILDDRLDFPVIVKANISTGSPEILGIGYLYPGDNNFGNKEQAFYWKLDKSKETLAKKSLISRLGKINEQDLTDFLF